MKINIGNKIISSTDFSNNETAWMIDDAILVLEYFISRKKIILGGDILTEKLKYNYDNWYYNMEPAQDYQFNLEYSAKLAMEYISNYIKENGNKFYVVFVTN